MNLRNKDVLIIIGVVLGTIFLISVMVYIENSGRETAKQRLSLEPLGERIPEMPSPHVKENENHAPYNSNPPTSGPHLGDKVAGPGIKNKQLADELVLHSLEHGAVVLWYKSDLPNEKVAKIKDVFQSASGKKIMLPREGLDAPVALTSWGYLLKLESIDEKTIKEFIEINNNRAPENAPI